MNPSDIFIKEMKDGAHFRRLRDSFMMSHRQFLDEALAALQRSRTPRDDSVLAASAAHSYNTACLDSCDYSSVVGSMVALRCAGNISHLSTVGRCKVANRSWTLIRGGIG